jgi:two-component system LytT family response regulator
VEEAEKLKNVLAESRPMPWTPWMTNPTGGPLEKLINIKDRGQISASMSTPSSGSRPRATTCIYTADNSLILRETMKDLERRLDPRVFQRVHRSWIVN